MYPLSVSGLSFVRPITLLDEQHFTALLRLDGGLTCVIFNLFLLANILVMVKHVGVSDCWFSTLCTGPHSAKSSRLGNLELLEISGYCRDIIIGCCWFVIVYLWYLPPLRSVPE